MEAQPSTKPPQNTAQAIGTFIENILKEPFAIDNILSELTVDQIGLLLDEQKQTYEPEQAGSLSPQDLTQKESYLRVRDNFCLLILELENQNQKDLSKEMLSQVKSAFFLKQENEKAQELPPLEGSIFSMDSQQAQEYLNFASYLELQQNLNSFPFSEALVTKQSMQARYLAVEAETNKKIQETLKEFWEQRKAAVQSLLVSQKGKIHLNPALIQFLEPSITEHSSWLLEGNFPHASLLNFLKFMLVRPYTESFRPTLFEIGALLFLFGQDITKNNLSLRNYFHCSGLSQEQLLEVFFRTSHLQQLRGLIFNAGLGLSKENSTILSDDIGALLTLISKLKVPPPQNSQKSVA